MEGVLSLWLPEDKRPPLSRLSAVMWLPCHRRAAMEPADRALEPLKQKAEINPSSDICPQQREVTAQTDCHGRSNGK